MIFIGASQDKHFRAVDEASGKTLWQVALKAGAHATPMTYLGRDGKQYVLVAAADQLAPAPIIHASGWMGRTGKP